LGSMDSAPVLKGKSERGSWRFGRSSCRQAAIRSPRHFSEHIEQSSGCRSPRHSTTRHSSSSFGILRATSGRGGLITFPESGWLASIVLPHQPHFMGSRGRSVLWGYGLSIDNRANFVTKTDVACTGRDHDGVMAICRLGSMRTRYFKTVPASRACSVHHQSVFAGQGRPSPGCGRSTRKTSPSSGQFCEQPEDVVSPWSIRSARRKPAVYSCWPESCATTVYKGK